MPNKSYAFKLTIKGPGGFAAEYEIPIGITTIGREPDNLLQLDDRTVSRYHARLECVSGECSITDLGSSNGTFINKQKIPLKTPVSLSDQDQIGLGPSFELLFSRTELAGEEAPAKAQVEIPPQEPDEPPAPPKFPLPPPLPLEDTFEKAPGGISFRGHYLLKYLPEIYHTEFMVNFLGIFESIQMPIIWTIDNFDQFLSPRTAPPGFLPWLANWFEPEFDSTWSEAQRRQFLEEAWLLYARRGTRWSLARVLEIYTGKPPVIDDLAEDLRPHEFRITLPVKEASINRASLENLILYFKPAHTDYELSFQG